jgi:hypothetical protein
MFAGAVRQDDDRPTLAEIMEERARIDEELVDEKIDRLKEELDLDDGAIQPRHPGKGGA